MDTREATSPSSPSPVASRVGRGFYFCRRKLDYGPTRSPFGLAQSCAAWELTFSLNQRSTCRPTATPRRVPRFLLSAPVSSILPTLPPRMIGRVVAVGCLAAQHTARTKGLQEPGVARGWRRSTTRPQPQPPPSTSCNGRPGRTGRSSAGSTPPACTSARMCEKPTATSRA